MSQEALEQYAAALKSGQKYAKTAESLGQSPYPPVLDTLLETVKIVRQEELGHVDIPAELIVGTKTAGRMAALAGNFMPLLGTDSEFASKWLALCDAHLGDTGIRDPIRCFEYLGRFYVQEGNKRVSVFKSFDAPTIPGLVTRLVPEESDDEERQIYDEFMAFHRLSGLYGLEFRKKGGYARLQAALGMEPDHVWTEEERRRFRAGYTQFGAAFERLGAGTGTTAEALLTWLEVYPFSAIKEQSSAELVKALQRLLPDIRVKEEPTPIAVSTEPAEKEKGLVSKILSAARPEHTTVAFIYGFPPEKSAWTRAHDLGRQALEQALGAKVAVRSFLAADRDYEKAMTDAIETEGARLIFATTPPMIDACRKIAAKYKNVKVLNCSLSQPYPGVRSYYSRIYECKFITGAIAGAMSGSRPIGYVANSPVFGTPASANAFALGARMTNPDARVLLDWACLPGDPVQRLFERGVSVVSNREIVSPSTVSRHFEMGTFRLEDDGSLLPLAVPFWDWGRLYERIIRSILSGSWKDVSASQAINYWWGMASGVLDVHLSEQLPDGVRSLGELLCDGIRSGSIQPFRTRILDQEGTLRCDGHASLTPEEIVSMDWFCNNVEGSIPAFDQLRPEYADTVRVLGLCRESLLPEAEGGLL